MKRSVHEIPTRQVIVGHFDMLGMTPLIEKDFNLACACLEDLYETQQCSPQLPISDRGVVREAIFSDTVLFYAADEGEDSLRTVIARSIEYFISAYRAGIPIRGGIARGRMVIREEQPSIFFGEALAKAYGVGESLAMLGVALDSELADRFFRAPFFHASGAEVVLAWSCLPSESASWLLNWPVFMTDFLRPRSKSPASVYGQFKGVGLQDFDNLPPAVKDKYQNTWCFLEQSLRGNDPCDQPAISGLS